MYTSSMYAVRLTMIKKTIISVSFRFVNMLSFGTAKILFLRQSETHSNPCPILHWHIVFLGRSPFGSRFYQSDHFFFATVTNPANNFKIRELAGNVYRELNGYFSFNL